MGYIKKFRRWGENCWFKECARLNSMLSDNLQKFQTVFFPTWNDYNDYSSEIDSNSQYQQNYDNQKYNQGYVGEAPYYQDNDRGGNREWPVQKAYKNVHRAQKVHKHHGRNQNWESVPEIITTQSINSNVVLDKCQGLPVVSTIFDDLEVVALVDSGASISILADGVYQQIRQKQKGENIANHCIIQSVTGHRINFSHCKRLSFKIGKKPCKNDFFITAEPLKAGYSIILGYDFLRQHKAVIDAGEGILRFPKRDIPLGVSSATPPHPPQPMQHVGNVKLTQKAIIEPGNAQRVVIKTKPTLTQLSMGPELETLPKSMANKGIQITSQKPNLATTQVWTLQNQSDATVHLNKNMIVGTVVHKQPDITCKSAPTAENSSRFGEDEESIEKIRKLRRQEFQLQDFDLGHLDCETKTECSNLLQEFAHVFSKTYATLGYTTKAQPEINLEHDYALSTKPYPLPHKLKDLAKKEIKDMLDNGIIERGNGAFAFPILMIKKSQKTKDGADRYRLAIDYRLLNSATQILPHQTPKIKDILQAVGGFKLYCSADLKSAFFQQLLRPCDRDKCGFVTPWGVYRPLRQMFGLRNAPLVFSRLMAEVLQDLDKEDIHFYMDDVIVAANSVAELLRKLQLLFQRLATYNLTLDPAKLQMCKSEINFLGFKISERGTEPSDQNVLKIMKVPRPTTKKHVQSFLGLCNYFRFLIPQYAEMITPLTEMTRPSAKFTWTKECQDAFLKLQSALTSKPIVAPYDPKQKLYLNTDASGKAISALLIQKKDGIPHIIANYSRVLSPTERRYPAIKAELLAVRDAIFHFREYLVGNKFVLLSDANSLRYNINLERQSDIVARWLLEISNYDYTFEHVRGVDNPADFLSREVVPQEKHVETLASIRIQPTCPNNTTILSHQLRDPVLARIISFLQIPDHPPSKQLKKYSLNCHGILEINFRNHKKILIPKSLQKDIIKWGHSAHMGKHKTTGVIVKSFYWPKVHRDISNYVASCHQCLSFKKHIIPNAEPIKVDRPTFPGEVLSLDLMGPYVTSSSGNKYILSVIDQYSRFAQFTPIKNLLASTVVKLLQRYFASFGAPRRIVTDLGSQFTSTSFQFLLKTWNICHAPCSVAHPTSNGLVERSHSTLKNRVAALTQGTFEWDQEIDLVTQWYNTSIHSQTGFTPSELFLMRKVVNPMHPDEQRQTFPCYTKFVEAQKEENDKIRKETMEIQLKCQQQQMKKAKNVRTRTFQVGTRVYLKNIISKRALANKFSGPYLVTEINKNNNVTIQLEGDPEAKPIKLNIDKLIIAAERLPHLQDQDTSQKIPESVPVLDGPAFNLRPRIQTGQKNQVANLKAHLPKTTVIPQRGTTQILPMNWNQLVAHCRSSARAQAKERKKLFVPTSHGFYHARDVTWCEPPVNTRKTPKIGLQLPTPTYQVCYPFAPIKKLPLHGGVFTKAHSNLTVCPSKKEAGKRPSQQVFKKIATSRQRQSQGRLYKPRIYSREE